MGSLSVLPMHIKRSAICEARTRETVPNSCGAARENARGVEGRLWMVRDGDDAVLRL